MKHRNDATPSLPVRCKRCRGSGSVPIDNAEDFHVEDSSPREIPIRTCPECGGFGEVFPKGSGH